MTRGLKTWVLAGCAGWAAWGLNAPAQTQAVIEGRRSPAEIFRAIEDPATGSEWLVERDEEHPGGPGRLVMVEPENRTNRSQNGMGSGQSPKPLPLVIHVGDKIVLAVHTAVMDVELEAVALGPAAVGSPLRVRLEIGGKILEAVAAGPGKANGNLESGARP